MSKPLTEAQVLKKLNISDFRHLSKDNVMSFASMLQDMDPEVAKKALEQFPDFAMAVMASIQDAKALATQSLKDDKESANRCYALLDQIQNALRDCLAKDNLSFEEKRYYLEQMKEVAQIASEKDSEGKRFKLATQALFGTIVAGAIAAAVAILGGNADLKSLFKKD